MRISWRNGGLFFEPESDVETEAILVLLAGLKYEGPPSDGGPKTATNVTEGLGQVERGLDLGL